ncbi:unnamed protein product [Trichobilharzia szidati]|nr:unnamed protein product [Trichobilharzia szidati]
MENYDMITPPPTHNIADDNKMIHHSISPFVISSLSSSSSQSPLPFSSAYPTIDKPMQQSMSVAPKWQYILLYIIPFGTLWGNIFVCLAVYLERRLRHRFNLFLVSLATSDLLCALLVMPVSAWNMIMGQNTSDLALCLVWYSLDIFFTATTIIHMCNISLDRYLALRQPFGTVRTQTRHPLNSLSVRITLSWLIPFSIAGPLFLYALMRQKDSEIDDKSKPRAIALTTTTTEATATSTAIITYNNDIMNTSHDYFSATKTSSTMTIEDYFHSTEASYKGCGPNDPAFALTAIFITFILPLIIMIVTYVLTVHTLRKHMKQIQAVQLYAATNKHFTDSNRLTASTTSKIINQNATNNNSDCCNNNNNNDNSSGPLKLSSNNNNDSIKLQRNEKDTTNYSCSSTKLHDTNLLPDSANISSKSTIPEQNITEIDMTETKALKCKQSPGSKTHWKLTRPNYTHTKQRRRHYHQQQQTISQTPETTMVTFTQTEEPSFNTSSQSFCDSVLIKTNNINTDSNNFDMTFDIKDELLGKKNGESTPPYIACNNNVTINNNGSSSMKIRYNTRQSSTTSNRYSLDRIHSAKRAVRVIGVLFSIFLICYLPFFIVYFIDVLCTTCNHCTGPAMAHLEWLGYLSSMLNPFVYHAFNPTFRRTFRRMLRCACFCPDRRRNEYYANWRRKIKL